jgi:hypothetical protein
MDKPKRLFKDWDRGDGGSFEALQVGKPYPGGRGSWPEGADYNFRSGGHELRIFLDGATQREVAAIQSEPVDFGLLVEPAGLMLVTRFGPLTFDCSYHWRRMGVTGNRTLPPPSEETRPSLRALLTIILLEASNGIVLVLRTVTFSPEFTRAIHQAIHDQAGTPYDRAGHQRWADSMVRYTTDQLWAQCTIRCQGGD